MSHHAKRIDGLVEETIEGELLVYNPATAEAHALNPTAAAVFRLCDGDTDRDAMVAALADQLRLPADGAWVDLALAELRDAGLVAGGDGPSSMTRRAVVRALITHNLTPVLNSIGEIAAWSAAARVEVRRSPVTCTDRSLAEPDSRHADSVAEPVADSRHADSHAESVPLVENAARHSQANPEWANPSA